jgi:glycine/D-amino acid oxidase-like deaminating enzyme
MTTIRIAFASLSAVLLLTLGAVVALAAPGAVSQAASPSGGAARAVYCPPGVRKQLKAAIDAFRKNMLKQRQAFFRTHHGSRDRAAFVKAQEAQLKALQKKLARCS